MRKGTWVPLHADAYFDPKITAAAGRLTRGDVEKMVGHLGRLWSWAIDHAETGDLSHLSPLAIANAAGWHGGERQFVNALIHVGLFDVGPKIHNSDEYFGRLLETRRRDRGRKRTAREAKKQEEMEQLSAGTSAGHPPDFQVLDDSDSDSDKTTSSLAADKDAVGTNVARALAALGRIPWYAVSETLDRTLLQEAATRAPGQDLAADVRRWAETAAKKGKPRRPRATLRGWLAHFGDQDRPVDPTDRIPSLEEQRAEQAWHREKSAET